MDVYLAVQYKLGIFFIRSMWRSSPEVGETCLATSRVRSTSRRGSDRKNSPEELTSLLRHFRRLERMGWNIWQLRTYILRKSFHDVQRWLVAEGVLCKGLKQASRSC